jgi:hypothetical protein
VGLTHRHLAARSASARLAAHRDGRVSAAEERGPEAGSKGFLEGSGSGRGEAGTEDSRTARDLAAVRRRAAKWEVGDSFELRAS